MNKLTSVLIAFIAMALAGCSAQDATSVPSAGSPPAIAAQEPQSTAPVPAVPDLAGDWKQTNSNSDEDFMTATISDDVIAVDWELGSQDVTAVYWVGTFEAPTDATEPFTWTSKRDGSKTDSALMASTDDTKDFTYADGAISYKVTIQGVSATVVLERA